MRNLKLNYQVSIPLSDPSSSPLICSLNSLGILNYISKTSQFVKFNLKTEEKEVFNIPSEFGSLVGIESLYDQRVCVFDSGVLFVDEDKIGVFNSNIESLSKSPDDELLLLLTVSKTIIILRSSDFESLTEICLSDKMSSFGQEGRSGDPNYVSCGWGSKETQFTGSEGKKNKGKILGESGEVTNDDQVLTSMYDDDDGRTQISWRSDGLFFATSILSSSKDRVVQIFERNGRMVGSSQSRHKGLGDKLSWRPNGLLTSFTRSSSSKYCKIVFFEKNGLLHGGFDFEVPLLIKDLVWNADGSVLAISTSKKITFWSVSNYDWSLKYSISTVIMDSETSHKIFWNPNVSHRLVLLSTSNLSVFEFSMTHCRSKGFESDDQNIVARIHGKTLRVTPFSNSVIPPPLFAFEIHLPFNILSIAFGLSNQLTVLTENNELSLYNYIQNNNNNNKYSTSETQGFSSYNYTYCLLSRITLEEDSLTNLTWIDSQKYLGSRDKELFLIESDKSRTQRVYEAHDVIYSITRKSSNVSLIQLRNGEMIEYREKGIFHTLLQTPSFCSQIEILGENIFGLDEMTHRLYVDGKELSSGVSSFVVTPNCLIVTSFKHELTVFPVRHLLQRELRSSQRKIERGSIIIVATGDSVILQMPRGNLEVVYPRELTISRLKTHLNATEYGKAFEILRRQRINLNLLVDHHPSLFLSNLNKFVSEIEDSSKMCQFIAELSNDDVTQSLYSDFYSNPSSVFEWTPNKIDDITERLLTLFKKDKFPLKLFPILSSYVKFSSRRTEEALRTIYDLEKNGDSALSKKSLDFLSSLTLDSEPLSETALKTYDLQILAFVSENSSLDPKEYLPLLNSLTILSESLVKYNIDKMLKRFELALTHISSSENDETLSDALNLIKTHKLYKAALKIFESHPFFYSSVCRAYAVYLEGKKYYQEAGMMYEAGNQIEEAVKAFEKASDWSNCLRLDSSSDLSIRLLRRLKEEKKFEDAFFIESTLLSQFENALVSLVEAHLWSQAHSYIHFIGRKDLCQTHLIPSLLEAATSFILSNRAHREEFEIKIKRLCSLRKNKEKELNWNEDFPETQFSNCIHENSDLISEKSDSISSKFSQSVSSSHLMSLVTRKTGASQSSKNKRKTERKKLSLKEGNPYEEIALLAFLHELIEGVYESSKDVKVLLCQLVTFKKRDLASEIQRDFKSLLDLIANSLEVIWIPDSETVFGPEATTEQIILKQKTCMQKSSYKLLDVHYRFPPSTKALCESWSLNIL